MSVAVERADRVRGIVLGNTWFWPTDVLTTKIFSRVMSSPPMQYAILQRNFFVERLIPAGTEHRPSAVVMEHYQAVQPSAAARVGVAEMPKQLLAARPLLETAWPGSAGQARRKASAVGLGHEGLRIQTGPDDPTNAGDFSRSRPRDELPKAKHFIQEDAPDRIAAAIIERFG